MSALVPTGATVQCSFGMATSSFTASGRQVRATGAVGVVTDISDAALAAFGSCTSLSNPQVAAATSAAGALAPQPCVPVVSDPWTPGAAAVTIGQVAALNASSQCTCSWGGVITVSSAGQTAVDAT